MASYYELPSALQIGLLILLFSTVCMGVCMMPLVYTRQKKLPKIVVILSFLLCGAMLSIYSSNVRSQKNGAAVTTVVRWVSEKPAFLAVILLLASLGYMAYLLRTEYRLRKVTITQFSIKEGLDSLSSGLCFCEADGGVILSNNCIQELCRKLMGRDLQNAVLFWQRLQNGEVVTDAVCLRQGETPSYRLSDGTVWSFAWEKLGNIYQLTAADTTQIHTLTSKLERENRQLEQFNQRLRDYGEKADALTRARERLEIKVKVHSMLGQALLATRRYLQDEDITSDEAMALWRHSVAVLRKEAIQETDKPLEALEKAAAATGITLVLKGEIPEETRVRNLFLQAAAESLTNAISHAKAKSLYVDFGEDPYSYCVTIYNDGLLPTGPIREGGGLSALRKNAERVGGQMEIKFRPQFILTVSIGKGGDRDV